MHDSDLDFDKTRIQEVERLVGSPIEPVTSEGRLLGTWDMRFGGPVGSDKIRWSYEFLADGRVMVRKDAWRWKLRGDGTLSLFVPIAPVPHIPGLKKGTVQEESYWAFQATGPRILFTNFDVSVLQVLTPQPTSGT